MPKERARPPEFEQWLELRVSWDGLELAVKKNDLKSPAVLDACDDLQDKLEVLVAALDPKPAGKVKEGQRP